MTNPQLSTNESALCGARLAIVSDGDPGTHLCVLGAGHDGAHRCDACDVKWVDGDDPKPVVVDA